jgi:GTPase SAR1 family protein
MKYFKNFKVYERTNDRVVSAKDLVKMGDDIEIIEFTYPYDKLFGAPSKNFDMAISGESGSGKSTFLLKFAYDLCKYGKVLYVSSEEFGSVTLIDKLKEIKNDVELELPENLFFSKGMTDFTDYRFVIIDSITDLEVDIFDYKELREIYDKTAFIIVLQYTKSKKFKGGSEWLHEVEIFCDIHDGVIEVQKNRYGVYGIYDFFNDKILSDDDKTK